MVPFAHARHRTSGTCHVSFHRKPHGRSEAASELALPLPDCILNHRYVQVPQPSNRITLQQSTIKQEKEMGEETSTKVRSSVRTKENGRDRGGTSTSTASPAPHTSSTSPSSHSTLAYVFLFLLVDLLGFTVILPLIPSLLEYYDKHDEVCCGFFADLYTTLVHLIIVGTYSGLHYIG